MSMIRCVLCAVLALGASAVLRGQSVVWERIGIPYPNTAWLNNGLAAVGDVDGDGFDDLVHMVTGFPGVADGVWTFSGRSGGVLSVGVLSPPGNPPAYGLWRIAHAGDVDGDGLSEYAVGRNAGDRLMNLVEIRSALDHRLHWTVSGPAAEYFGQAIASNLDVDGDRKPDLLVGAYRWNGGAGGVHVYSNSGAFLYTAVGPPGTGAVGFAVAAVGDVDGDACDEFVARAVGPSNGPLLLFSGKTGAIMRSIPTGSGPGQEMLNLRGCGDIDADGAPDFVGDSGIVQLPLFQVFSSRTGNVLFQGPHVGAHSAGDVDLDGVPDLLVQLELRPRHIEAWSGRTGQPMWSLEGPTPNNWYGAGATCVLRQPGSRFPWLVMNDPAYSVFVNGQFQCLGRTRVVDTTPPRVAAYGLACAGTLSTTPGLGLRAIGAAPNLATRIHMTGGEPGGQGVLLLGVSRTSWNGLPLPWPLALLGFPTCVLQTSVEAIVPLTLGSTGVDRGYAYVDLPLPLGNDFTVHGQWLGLGSGSTTGGASEGLLWRH